MSNESNTSGFQPGVPSNALTSLIAKGVRQHLKAKGIEAKHSDILTGIAKALGLENANALRALAETGEHPRGSVPREHARYFRTRYVFDVLADDEPLTTHDLSLIDYETDEGRCVGYMKAVHVTPLTAGEMREELLEAGNDGSFFDLDDPDLVEEADDADDASGLPDGREYVLSAGADGQPELRQQTMHTLPPETRAIFRLACHLNVDLKPEKRPRATLEDAWRLARAIARNTEEHGSVLGHLKGGQLRHVQAIFDACDPDRSFQDAPVADFPGMVLRAIGDTGMLEKIPAFLAQRQPGIQATLAAHGPRHIAADHAMPLVTRLLAQEMRNAVNAGEEPLLREAYDSVRQCGESLWADIDPGVEMTRIDADGMVAILKALVDHIGGEADVEELLRREGIQNPYSHRSETTPATHRPDGDRPVIQTRGAYLVEATYLPADGESSRTHNLLVAANATEAARRTATGLMAGHPSTDRGGRVTNLSITQPAQEADKLKPFVSRALRRICDHLTREADYALTLDRVRLFVQTHSADALAAIVRDPEAFWTRDTLVAELAALAAAAVRGWDDEEIVARLA